MPRVYKHKKESQVDYNKVTQAVQRVQGDGISIRQAAEEFGICHMTIFRHLQSSRMEHPLSNPGRQSALPSSAEADIASLIKSAASHGFAIQRSELKGFVESYVIRKWNDDDEIGCYLRRHCSFKQKSPGDEWIRSFLHRYHLSLLIPNTLERKRKDASSDPFLIYEYYDLLERELDRLEIRNKPENIWNVDESSFFTDPSRGRVVGEKGTCAYRAISSSGRDCFTAMAAVNAAGGSLSPLIIFKGKNLQTTWKGSKALAGTTYSVSGE
jgi:hypothetical protein